MKENLFVYLIHIYNSENSYILVANSNTELSCLILSCARA